MKIRAKLLVTFLPVCLLTLLGAGAVFYLEARSFLRREALSQLESLASVQARRIEGLVRRSHDGMALLTSQRRLRLVIREYSARR
ncbi:MAG TPA: hypothetical protein VEK15_04570, partial [Vicinamibacteria bacterium]|nr:hypothetical protein [Vicinamibacteria bacterium]